MAKYRHDGNVSVGTLSDSLNVEDTDKIGLKGLRTGSDEDIEKTFADVKNTSLVPSVDSETGNLLSAFSRLIPYDGSLHILWLGDSITQGTSSAIAPYSMRVRTMDWSNAIGINNCHCGGCGIYSPSAGGNNGWYKFKVKIDNWEYENRNRPIGSDAINCIVFEYGTNDFGFDSPLGTIDDTTDGSFYGSCYACFDYLERKFPNVPIIVIPPTKRGERDWQNSPNDAGAYLWEYRDALMAQAMRHRQCFILDFWDDWALDPHKAQEPNCYFIYDLLHPNAKGYQYMASKLLDKIKVVMGICGFNR